MTDPVERNEEFERKILAIPEDAFLNLQRRVRLLLVTVVLGIAGGIVTVIVITSSTNDVVEDRVVPTLEDKVAGLEAENAQLKDISNQQTDAILLLIEEMQAAGLTPPEIVIRATTTTTEEPDG